MTTDDDPLDSRVRALAEPDLRDDDDELVRARVNSRLFGAPPTNHRLGRFELRDRLGRGGMGAVYEAWDPELRRRVAIKRLRLDLGSHARRRGIIEAEARALAQIADRHVVQVYETGEHDGGLFVVMELVDGASLLSWQSKKRTVEEVLDKYVQAGRGLSAAHRAGLVHRDFKPGNVLVRDDGEVRVADFGLALALDRDALTDESMVGGDDATRAPGSGSHSGTRAYMAPEQLAFGNADARTDQFSFCVALHEALTGVRPYDEAQLATIATLPHGEIEAARGTRRLPAWIASILARGLARRPAARWPSMDALVHALAQTPQRIRRRRVAIATGVVGIAVGAWMLRPAAPVRSCDPSPQLAAVWHPDRAQAVRNSAPSEIAFAGPTLVLATAALDRHGAAWVDAYTDACHRAWVDGTLAPAQYERSVSCFDASLRSMGQAIELIGAGDPELLARTGDIIAALPDPLHCEDLDAVDARTAREDELLAGADRARLLVAGGQPHGALEIVEALALGQADHQAAAAAAWITRGLALVALARRDEAEAAFSQAYALALALDANRLGLEASRELLVLYAHGFEDRGRARLAEVLLEAWTTRLELSPRERALSADASGLAAAARGDLAEAERFHREAIAALDGVDDGVARARARRRLGSVLQRARRFDEAAASYDEAAAQVLALLGPDHPELGDNEHALGSLALDRGDLDAASDHFERALALHERALGIHSVRLASTLAVLGHVALHRGELANAERLATRAWALQATLPIGHPDRGSALLVLASVHLQSGEYSTSLREHEQIEAELSSTASADERDFVSNNIGWLLCRVARCVEARRHFEVVAAHQQDDSSTELFAQGGLAMVELAEGAPRVAEERARRALATAVAAQRLEDAELIAELRWSIAVAMDRIGGRREEVEATAALALAWYRDAARHAEISAELEGLIARHE